MKKMDVKDLVRLPDPYKDVEIEAKEVLRDIDVGTNVFIRIKITGWHFPPKARKPFVVIGEVLSRFVIIEPDELAANAYFDEQIFNAKIISFGYGKVIMWDFKNTIDFKNLARLDRRRFKPGIIDPFKMLQNESYD